jgi:hypothetical protein
MKPRQVSKGVLFPIARRTFVSKSRRPSHPGLDAPLIGTQGFLSGINRNQTDWDTQEEQARWEMEDGQKPTSPDHPHDPTHIFSLMDTLYLLLSSKRFTSGS